MKQKSPLRYAGGKSKAIKILKQYIPPNTKEICSPFFGGGSFEIFLASQGIKIYGYDNFEPLICFWNSLLNDKKNLYNRVKTYYPLSKEKFYFLQKNIKNIEDEIEIGAIFYVLNRCSFSGTGLSGGMSNNHPRFTTKQIESLLEFDVKFEIKLLSFEKSILQHDCLIYADPPYLIKQSLYGNKGDMHKNFDHNLLAEILNKRGNFILCYNNSEEIKNMYKEHNFHYPKWKYGMGTNKESNEILIISKDL